MLFVELDFCFTFVSNFKNNK